MKLYSLFLITVATAAKFENLRQKTILQHPRNTLEIRQRNTSSKHAPFDQLTWMLNRYRVIEGKFTEPQLKRTYNIRICINTGKTNDCKDLDINKNIKPICDSQYI